MRLIAITDDQFNTITSALTWYADDRRECARTERHSDADADNHERVAGEADALREALDRTPAEALKAAAEEKTKLKAIASAALAVLQSKGLRITTYWAVVALQKLGDALVDYNGAPLGFRGTLNPNGEKYDDEPTQAR